MKVMPFAALLPAPATMLRDGDGDPFDRLTTAPVQRRGDRERVTTVVVAYAPGEGLLASVRSLIAQTWTNHEVVVVDDASPHGHDDVFRRAVALDPRVRLLRLDGNAGTYVARNQAMAMATGDYVTFQDVDAWSHPVRLERQVASLRAGGHRAVRCAALEVTPEHAVTPVDGPLMIRRGAGRFDGVRHGGDDELAHRLGAHRLAEVLVLRKPGPDGRHLRTALRAYASSYRRTGEPRRPWPLLEKTGRRPYDVLMVADWSQPQAGLGQLRALAARGARVAFTHWLDSDLDGDTQDAVDRGEVEQVDITDDVRARLVVVRDTRVVRDAPVVRSGLRATRVVLESSTATGARHLVAACRRLFKADPVWAPPGPHTRRLLATTPGGLPLAELDVPATVAAGDWHMDRRASGARTAVAGARGEWRRLAADLPAHPLIDLRLLARDATAPPPSLLVYPAAELGLRRFLHQLDFYLPLPGPRRPADPEPDVLAALAAGCVVVLPPRYAATFGDAAVYATGPELIGTIRGANRAAHRARARDWVTRNHHHDLWAERISALTP